MLIVLAVLFLVLGLAWLDGGRVEERLMEQQVELAVPAPAATQTAGAGAGQ